MAQSTFSVNMESNLKDQFDLLCEEFGMTASAVINKFVQTAVKNRKFPPEITNINEKITRKKALQAFYDLRKEAEENGLQGMTLEEINQEIAEARKSRKV